MIPYYLTLLIAAISSMAKTHALAAPTSKFRSTSGLFMSPWKREGERGIGRLRSKRNKKRKKRNLCATIMCVNQYGMGCMKVQHIRMGRSVKVAIMNRNKDGS